MTTTVTAAKERPILFNGAMVRAILAGRKIQTRRVVKPQPVSEGMKSFGESWAWGNGAEWFSGVTAEQLASGFGLCHPSRLPWAPGDRLWGRETWSLEAGGSWYEVTYKADDATKLIEPASNDQDARLCRLYDTQQGDWRPSIHMPRDLSRILLEVVSVRVERLRDISEADAQVEGLSCLTKDDGRTWKYGLAEADGLPGPDGWAWRDWNTDPRAAFAQLWDGIAKPGERWGDNPWVWVVEFKRVEPA